MAALSALTLDASAQLPAPLLYYPFDEAADSTAAADLSGNGYTGTVVGSVVFGGAGAPGGATPGGAARFSVEGNGLINVTGLDVPTLLGNREGTPEQANLSYTMACWILPDAASLSGEHFFFGQSLKGIHNGLNQDGRPYQGHWASDHGGTTQLNSTDWAHLTFTYDGINDVGTIYLNGVQDGPAAPKISPNGSGNFVIGARQGAEGNNTGQAHFAGLIDDVVVYQEVLTQGQIALLADGVNPGNRDDSDFDGMNDSWEVVNLGLGADLDNGSTNINFGPAGDPDSDSSNNLEEFQRLTDPLDNDSDDDNVWDGDESGTGIWNGILDTGTDPKNPDSDGDGLIDGVENPDLAYIGPSQTGSNPNLTDTDLDGFSDDVEVGAGSNPNNILLFPAPTNLPIVDDFESSTLNKLIWLTNTDIPQGGAAAVQEMGHVRLSGRGHLYTRDQYDPVALGGLYIRGHWTFAGSNDFLQILTRSDATPSGQYGETQTGIEFLANQSNGDCDIRTRGTEISLIGNQKSGDITFTPGTTYEFVIIDDDNGNLVFCIWELGNAANIAAVRNSIASSNATSNHIVIHNREGAYTSNLEEIVIGVLTDSDSDNMPDFWEAENGLLVNTNDADLDKDNDGLTNLAEFLSCTDPDNNDTDGDGLLDGVENNNNFYVDANQTGTDPLDPDSDDDGLGDLIEIPSLPHVGINQPGTDPNNPDTDFDGTEDRVEIVKGSDPADAGSLAPAGFPILYYSFEQGSGSVIFDQTLNDFDGTIVENLAFVSGAPGGPTPGNGIAFTSAANGYLNVPGLDINSMIRNVGGAGNGSYTMSCWLKPEEGTAGNEGFIFGQTNQGMHLGLRNGGRLHSAHWGSDWDANTILNQDVWVHVTWTYDGSNDTANIYLNGVLDGGPTAQNPTNGGGNLMIGSYNNDLTPETRFKGCLDEIAVWDEVLPLVTIRALANGANPLSAPTGADRLVVLGYTYDPRTGAMSLTWESQLEATYTVNYDTNLEGSFAGVVNGAVLTQGETTSLFFNRTILGANAGAPKLFFKVTEN